MRINYHDIVKHAIADREIELRRMLEARRTREPPSSLTLNDLYTYMINGNVRISHLMYVRILCYDIFKCKVSICLTVSFIWYDRAQSPLLEGIIHEVPKCVICKEDMAAGADVRILQECMHSFHVRCITQWTNEAETCPVCRRVVVGREVPLQD
jgi:hypothetical protein